MKGIGIFLTAMLVLSYAWAAQADVITIKALANNKYVQAQSGGAQPLLANTLNQQTWEQYNRTVSGSTWYLKSLANNKYVQAAAAGANPLIAAGAAPGSWEAFTATLISGSTYSLKANINGKYVCADNAGASPLIANRTSVGGWEQFTVTVVGTPTAPPPGSTASWHDDWVDNMDSWQGGIWQYNSQAYFNQEVQCYTNWGENHVYGSGILRIRLVKKNPTVNCTWAVPKDGRTLGWASYTSGRIITKNIKEHQGGAWECRLQMTTGRTSSGIWPAWWLLGWRINEAPRLHADENVAWPNWGAGEIDIWEALGRMPDRFLFNAYYGGSNNATIYQDASTWRNYRVEFSGSQLLCKVNGTQVAAHNVAGSFNYPMYAILNLALGGSFGGTIATSISSAGNGTVVGELQVDWVKHQSWY